MRKFLQFLLVMAVLFLGTMKVVHATSFVNLNIKNNGVTIYSGTIPLSATPSENSVLSVIKQADILSPDFTISNIIHYSFGDYLKCITISGNTELCDNWQYKINGDSPALGMDSYTLSGGENILLYFGDDVSTTENSGGPLTTGYIPPPAPAMTILPTSTPESESVVLPPPITTSVLPPITKTPPNKSKIKQKKLSLSEKENTASVINAVPSPAPTTQTQTPKKNWFMRLLSNIFGNL
jgi:hypothetical protein